MFNKKAEIGIGTLILFIAMILVAAIAASVLIQTATSLQNKALLTGDRAKSSISVGIETLVIYGEDGSDGNVEIFNLKVKLIAGSDTIRFNETMIEIMTKNDSRNLEYGGTNCSAATGNSTHYFVKHLLLATNYKEGYVQRGEVAQICLEAPYSLTRDEDITFSIVPSVGLPIIIETALPDYIYTTRSDMKKTRHNPDWNLDTGYTSLFPIRKKIRAYEDMVHYALSPEKYINYNFEIDPVLGFNINDYPDHGGYKALKMRGNPRIPITKDEKKCIQALIGVTFISLINSPQHVANMGGTSFGIKRSSSIRISEIAYYIPNLMRNIHKAFRRFEARLDSEWVMMREVYGSFSNVDQVPRNTIGYMVSGTPPPLPKGVDYKNADFWSKIFGTEMGSSILNAVAHNMPVSIKTKVSKWKDLRKSSWEKIEDKSGTFKINKKFLFKYVYQDFDIEIGKNNNILVKYDKGTASQTFNIFRDRAWVWVAKQVLAIAAVYAVGVAGAAAAAGGTGAGVAGATGGTAIGTTGGTIAAGGAAAGGGGISLSTVGTAAGLASTGAGLISKGGKPGINISTPDSNNVPTVQNTDLNTTGTKLGVSDRLINMSKSVIERYNQIKPLLNTGMSLYSAKNRKNQLPTSLRMSEIPISQYDFSAPGAYADIGPAQMQYDQYGRPYNSQRKMNIPVDYFLIGGIGLIATLIITLRR